MGKKLPYTPSSQIRTALRRLWLRSRERQAALKRDKYTCQRCGGKQSKAKGREFAVEVHHKSLVSWEELVFTIRQYLLHNPDKLETLCLKCHDGKHKSGG